MLYLLKTSNLSKCNSNIVFVSRGTHGYMAPEVLSKGKAYDSSADWFSFGCMLYKLLKGHSPFRQHKTKDKHEIDRMTLTMVSKSLNFIISQILFLLFSNKCKSKHFMSNKTSNAPSS